MRSSASGRASHRRLSKRSGRQARKRMRTENGGYRRDHLRALAQRVEVDAPEEYERWLEGSIEDVIAFQFRPPFPSERFIVDRTDELWVPRARKATDISLLGARHSSGASSY